MALQYKLDKIVLNSVTRRVIIIIINGRLTRKTLLQWFESEDDVKSEKVQCHIIYYKF